MQIEDKKRGLRNFALRVADFNEYDFEEFFMQRTKTIKKCDKLITDIKLAESVSTIWFYQSTRVTALWKILFHNGKTSVYLDFSLLVPCGTI